MFRVPFHHFAVHLAGLTPLQTWPTDGGTSGKAVLRLVDLKKTTKGFFLCAGSHHPLLPPLLTPKHASAPERPQTRLLQNFWRAAKIKVSCTPVYFLLFTLRCRLPVLCCSSVLCHTCAVCACCCILLAAAPALRLLFIYYYLYCIYNIAFIIYVHAALQVACALLLLCGVSHLRCLRLLLHFAR